jgi:hypothetical protein
MNDSCPFRKGYKYRVKRDYSLLNHSFNSGEIVVFGAFGYDFKAGVTRYWFKKIDSKESNAWHVFDNQKADFDSMDLFEEIGPV